MPLYVAAYDVTNDRARLRVARVLLAYGVRVQKSVFAVRLDAGDLAILKRRVGICLGLDDKFDLFPLDERNPERRIKWQEEPETWHPVEAC